MTCEVWLVGLEIQKSREKLKGDGDHQMRSLCHQRMKEVHLRDLHSKRVDTFFGEIRARNLNLQNTAIYGI